MAGAANGSGLAVILATEPEHPGRRHGAYRFHPPGRWDVGIRMAEAALSTTPKRMSPATPIVTVEHPSSLAVDSEEGYGVHRVTANYRTADEVDHDVATARFPLQTQDRFNRVGNLGLVRHIGYLWHYTGGDAVAF